MSEELPAVEWQHPLLPWLEGLAVNSRPLVAFAPHAGIQHQIDLACLGHPLLGEDEAKRNMLATYRHSAALVPAIFAGGGSSLDGENLHALIFTAAQADTMAFALCDAAGFALRAGTPFFSAFAVSTRLPGFLDALAAWVKQCYGKPFSGGDEFQDINRQMVQKDAPEAGFWLKACEREFSPTEFMRACHEEMDKFDETTRKRATRKPRRQAEFKDSIRAGWIPLSLWARTSAGIVFLLAPKCDSASKAEGRVKRDINELDFSNSHRGDLGRFVENAELEAKKLSAGCSS
jgi:hypothetical protein